MTHMTHMSPSANHAPRHLADHRAGMRVQTDTVRRGFVLVLAEAVRCFSKSVDSHPARAMSLAMSTDRSQLSTTHRQQMDQQVLQQVRV